MNRQLRHLAPGNRRSKPVYIKAAPFPRTQRKSGRPPLPEFHPPEQMTKEESPRRRAVAKHAAGAWHLGR